jgi:hypothetical protein
MFLRSEGIKNTLNIFKNTCIFMQSRTWLGHLASKSGKWKEL